MYSNCFSNDHTDCDSALLEVAHSLFLYTSGRSGFSCGHMLELLGELVRNADKSTVQTLF